MIQEIFFLQNPWHRNTKYEFSLINFWRTTYQTEIDFIVQGEYLFKAIEVKWDSVKKPKSFATIRKQYPGIETNVISRNDFL